MISFSAHLHSDIISRYTGSSSLAARHFVGRYVGIFSFIFEKKLPVLWPRSDAQRAMKRFMNEVIKVDYFAIVPEELVIIIVNEALVLGSPYSIYPFNMFYNSYGRVCKRWNRIVESLTSLECVTKAFHRKWKDDSLKPKTLHEP